MFDFLQGSIEVVLDSATQEGIRRGEYYLHGGVVRRTTGRREIVKWLRPGDFKVSPTGLIPGLNLAVNLVGIGLMQLNFMVVNKKLARIEESLGRMEGKVDALAGRVEEVAASTRTLLRRQYTAMLGKARAGCQLAHDAARMNDRAAARHQVVVAKGYLLESETFFAGELEHAELSDPQFPTILALACHTRLTFARCSVFLGDAGLAVEQLEALRAELDQHALRQFRRNRDRSEREASAIDRLNELLAVRELLALHVDQLTLLRETGEEMPYGLGDE